MTDEEFAAWLRSYPREKPSEEVERLEALRDEKRGQYVPHHHHVYYEMGAH